MAGDAGASVDAAIVEERVVAGGDWAVHVDDGDVAGCIGEGREHRHGAAGTGLPPGVARAAVLRHEDERDDADSGGGDELVGMQVHGGFLRESHHIESRAWNVGRRGGLRLALM